MNQPTMPGRGAGRPQLLRRAVGSIVLAGALTIGTVALAPAAQAAPTVSDVGLRATAPTYVRDSAMDRMLVAYINHARVAAGLAPVTTSSAVARIARYWSAQMLGGETGGTLRHNPLFATMIRANETRAVTFTGENVAAFTAGAYSPREIFNMYMASPGHRANILNPSFRYVGIFTLRGNGPTAYNTINFAG